METTQTKNEMNSIFPKQLNQKNNKYKMKDSGLSLEKCWIFEYKKFSIAVWILSKSYLFQEGKHEIVVF